MGTHTLILLAIGTTLFAQDSAQVLGLGAGKFLVAKAELGDPNFSRTVILLVDYSERGSFGLILNRRADISLPNMFEKEEGVRDDPAYEGGPVLQTGVMALVRTHTPPGSDEKQARRVLGDVYFTTSIDLLKDLVRAKSPPETFRVYLGYAGWGPQQLDNEVKSGAWYVRRGRPDLIFDPKPDTLWKRLADQAEMRFASLAHPPR